MVVLLPPSVPQSVALGSLLAFRLIYYVLPLTVAVLLLLGFELHQRREELGKAAKVVGGWLPAVEPHLLAVLTFLGGAVMLAFGSVPAAPARLRWLADFVPLTILELSHFLGSLVGIGLIFLAWGLRRRLEVAYYLATGLLALSVVLSLLRGLHVEAAVFLTLMLAALLPARRAFYRRAAILSEPFSGAWLAAVAMVVIGAAWIGFFAYRHVDYSTELWWQFELLGNASRFLRSGLAVAIGLVSIGIARLLGPAAPREAPASEETRALVREVVAHSPAASAHLALLGDKQFLIAPSKSAFVMYAVRDRSWVAMGDPVGPSDEHAELIWHFHSLADRHGGWTVFYEVGEKNLPVYLDLGLTVLKIGEEASSTSRASPSTARSTRGSATTRTSSNVRGARLRSCLRRQWLACFRSCVRCRTRGWPQRARGKSDSRSVALTRRTWSSSRLQWFGGKDGWWPSPTSGAAHPAASCPST